MKSSVLYGCIGILLVSVILLSIYISNHKRECERTHIDDNMRLWGTDDAVPDKETAIRIADIILKKQDAFKEDCEYKVDVTFNEISNEWKLHYSPGIIIGGDIEIYIRRDCGMITGLDYYK